MSIRVLLAGILALIWGTIWACVLQFTKAGRFLVHRRTWITVVIGIGVDLAIAAIILPWEKIGLFVLILGASAVPIVIRSLWNECQEDNETRANAKENAR